MKISPEMRAAIDKAVAEGRVTKVPIGVSGIPQDTPHEWKAQRDTFFKNARRGSHGRSELFWSRTDRINHSHRPESYRLATAQHLDLIAAVEQRNAILPPERLHIAVADALLRYQHRTGAWIDVLNEAN